MKVMKKVLSVTVLSLALSATHTHLAVAQSSPGMTAKVIESLANSGAKLIDAARLAFGGADIGGDTKIRIDTGNIIAIAADDWEVKIGACGVSGAKIGGDMECKLNTGDIVAIAYDDSAVSVSLGEIGYR